MRPLIAIVGRPNVGKSTLFNKLVHGRPALVEDVPGVTRDRHYAEGDYDRIALAFVDTGGFVPESKGAASEPTRPEHQKKRSVGGGVGGKLPTLFEDKQLLASIRAQAQLAIEEAAAIILVCDASEGLLSSDIEVAKLLKKSGKPMFVAANKVDSERRAQEFAIAEFYDLGVPEVFSISAEHGLGLEPLMDAVVASLPEKPSIDDAPPEIPDDGKIRLAVVGRPNVGKSTLLNAILGKERFIASPVPGTTHDAVDEEFTYKSRHFILTDTAGIRRRKSISAKVEAYSVIRSLKAIEQADIAVVLVDPNEIGVDQDAKIVGLAEEKGRALIIVVNKWDTVEDDEAQKEKVKEMLADRIDFVPWAPVLFVSALKSLRTGKVLDTAIRLFQQASTRLPTPELNKWLQETQDSQPAPLWRGFPVKFYYAAQVSQRPITIAISTNRPAAIDDGYKRFMLNKLRETFELEVPIRIVFKEKAGLETNRKRRQGHKEDRHTGK